MISMDEKFEVKKENGKVIRGLIITPEKKKDKYPVIVFSHGFGACYAWFLHHGRNFADHGICTVFFDFCGGGKESTSDGTMLEMTINTERSDLNDILSYVKTLSFADIDNLFLAGESQGGVVSSIIAAEHAEEIKGLCMWYPAFVIPDDSRKRIEAGVHDIFGNEVCPEYDEVAVSLDLFNIIGGYKGPVRIIHGDKDGIAPISYSERAVGVYENASLYVMKGSDHGFDEINGPKASDLTWEFVLENSK